MRLQDRLAVSTENASTHADNAEAAVMASADLMGGQQLGAESPDASDAENAPPRSSSCPPARGRQTSAVQPGQAQQGRTARACDGARERHCRQDDGQGQRDSFRGHHVKILGQLPSPGAPPARVLLPKALSEHSTNGRCPDTRSVLS